MIYLVSKAGMHIGDSYGIRVRQCNAVESALAFTMHDEAMIVGCQVAAQLRSLEMMLHFLY
jgi:hypothetical protein